MTLILHTKPSHHTYIQHINLNNNNHTHNKIIHHKFHQYKTSWYNNNKIHLSHNQINHLNFFTKINIKTQKIPNSPNQINLIISITKKPTNSLQLNTKKITLNTKFIIPFPNTNNNKTLHLFTFLNINNIYKTNKNFNLKKLQTSTNLNIN